MDAVNYTRFLPPIASHKSKVPSISATAYHPGRCTCHLLCQTYESVPAFMTYESIRNFLFSVDSPCPHACSPGSTGSRTQQHSHHRLLRRYGTRRPYQNLFPYPICNTTLLSTSAFSQTCAITLGRPSLSWPCHAQCFTSATRRPALTH